MTTPDDVWLYVERFFRRSGATAFPTIRLACARFDISQADMQQMIADHDHMFTSTFNCDPPEAFGKHFIESTLSMKERIETMGPIQTEMFKDKSAPKPKMTTARQLKEEGIQQALDNANENWKFQAQFSVKTLCSRLDIGGKFTADDVNELLDKAGIKTHNNSAMGGIFKTMSSKGWIEHSGYTKSKRPASHARVIGVWKVLKIV